MPHHVTSALFSAFCFLALLALPGTATAAAPTIAFSTKFSGIDFLFTEAAAKRVEADGSNFQTAIRDVGFELISRVGNSAKSTTGMQAILIDGIKIKDKKSLVVLGIIVDGKFQSLNFNGSPPNQEVGKFLEELQRNRVLLLRVDGKVGVDLFMADE